MIKLTGVVLLIAFGLDLVLVLIGVHYRKKRVLGK